MTLFKTGSRQGELLLAAAFAFALAGCAVEPLPKDALKQAKQAPPAWVAPQPHGGQALTLQDWWAQFDDPILGQLIAQTQAANPSLQQAVARIKQARAQAVQAGGGRFPAVDLNAAVQGQRLPLAPGVPTQTLSNVSLDAAWEIDLFARVRQQREAAEARAQASELDWHAARVSLAAEVAQSYVSLRACERLTQISGADVEAMTRLSQWSSDKLKVGFESSANDALLQAAAADGQNRLLNQRAECDLVVKALVSLSGAAEADLRAQLAPAFAKLPSSPGLQVAQLPAATLAQRPDLAALQSQVLAAWSERGAAQAARYPQLQLGGSISLSALQVSGVVGGGGRVDGNGWSFGPSLTLPIFDAGARRANADAALARFEESLAGYRAAVLMAVREVEEALVRLDSAQQRERYAQSSADGYQRSAAATAGSWRAGLASAADLEQARRLTLNAQSALVQVQAARLAAWLSLYKASGGGWQAATSQRPVQSSGAAL